MTKLDHDSFDSAEKFIVTKPARAEDVPPRLQKGQMISQRYGIGGEPWTPKWSLDKDFLPSTSPAHGFNANSASRYFSIGAPYIVRARDQITIGNKFQRFIDSSIDRSII